MQYSVETKDLCKAYDTFKLDHINIRVPKGTIVGLVGGNGAGKTTTIKLLLNLIKRDSGTVEIFGKDNITNEVEIKGKIGVVFDECCFYDGFNAKDINKILKPSYAQWSEKTYFEFLNRFDLPPQKAIKEYSRGMKMKLSIATALSHNPMLLILDEPTSGLDPIVRNEILDVFQEFIQDEERAILLSSHITSDLERIADYICFINNGRQVFFKEKDELLEKYGILKCGLEETARLDKKDILGVRKNKFGVEVLVSDKNAAAAKYPFGVIDHVTIDEIMVLSSEGVNV